METNNISIIIEIEEVLRINDKDYSITFSTYFNVEWVEKRLAIMPQWAAEMGLDNSSGRAAL